MQPKNSNTFMFILFATSIGLVLALGFFIAVMQAADPAFTFNAPMWALFLGSQLLVFGVPFGIYLLIHRDKIKEILPMRPLGGVNVLMVVGMSLLIQPLFMLVNLISQLLFPNVIIDAIVGVGQEGGFVLTLAIIAVVPSIFEEITFRGVGFAGYKHVKIRTAAIINGLMFGMIHMNMNQFIYAFVLGALFCYFMYYTKSLWAPVLAHFVFNGTQSLMAYAAINLDPYALYAADMPMDFTDIETVLAIGALVIVALVFTGGFIAVYIAFKHHNLKRNKAEGIVTDTAAEHAAAGGPRPTVFTWAFWMVCGLFVLMMLGNYLLPLLATDLVGRL